MQISLRSQMIAGVATIGAAAMGAGADGIISTSVSDSRSMTPSGVSVSSFLKAGEATRPCKPALAFD